MGILTRVRLVYAHLSLIWPSSPISGDGRFLARALSALRAHYIPTSLEKPRILRVLTRPLGLRPTKDPYFYIGPMTRGVC